MLEDITHTAEYRSVAMHGMIRARILAISLKLLALLAFVSITCKHTTEPNPSPTPLPDSIYNPSLGGTFTLCYVKGQGGRWNVFTSGSSPRNISQLATVPSTSDDEYPAWSPDGRYIAFRRSALVFGPSIHVYDLTTNTDTNVTADGGLAASLPQWTRDGQLCVAYQRPIGSPAATYLMKPDGSGKRKILDPAASAIYRP